MSKRSYTLECLKPTNVFCFDGREAKLVLLIVAFLCLNASLNLLNKVRAYHFLFCCCRVLQLLLEKNERMPQRMRFRIVSHYVVVSESVTFDLLLQWTLTQYGMPYPLALTCGHMGFSFLVLMPLSLKSSPGQHLALLKRQSTGILFIGSSMALNIALNNVSLLYVSLSLNQIIRSSIPAVTCIMAILVERKIPSCMETVSLLILCAGVIIVVWEGSVSGNLFGVFLCLIGTFSNALMMTLSSKLLSQKLDPIELTFYTAPISLLCLAPFMLKTEYKDFAIFVSTNGLQPFGIILIGCMNALLYNLVHYLVIKQTSAVTSTVLGQVKIVGLVILAAFLLDERKDFSTRMVVGSLISLVGFSIYSQIEIKRLKSRNLTSNLDTNHSLSEATSN